MTVCLYYVEFCWIIRSHVHTWTDIATVMYKRKLKLRNYHFTLPSQPSLPISASTKRGLWRVSDRSYAAGRPPQNKTPEPVVSPPYRLPNRTSAHGRCHRVRWEMWPKSQYGSRPPVECRCRFPPSGPPPLPSWSPLFPPCHFGSIFTGPGRQWPPNRFPAATFRNRFRPTGDLITVSVAIIETSVSGSTLRKPSRCRLVADCSRQRRSSSAIGPNSGR